MHAVYARQGIRNLLIYNFTATCGVYSLSHFHNLEAVGTEMLAPLCW